MSDVTLTDDQRAVLEWLPVGEDNARLLHYVGGERPFGLTKCRRLAWQLRRLGLVSAKWCGTYGAIRPLGRRYRVWYRKEA